MRARVFSAFRARFAKESTGGFAVIPCSHRSFARIHHSYVVMSYELFVLVCTIVNLHPQTFACIQSCQGNMLRFFSDGRWIAHLCCVLVKLKLQFEVKRDNSVTPGHRDRERGERNTWCPKENDFFVLPRSDELLAAEASTKPELIDLSAGDSWQHAMALRQLSVTVGLGTVLFIQRLAVVSRFAV